MPKIKKKIVEKNEDKKPEKSCKNMTENLKKRKRLGLGLVSALHLEFFLESQGTAFLAPPP